MNPAPLLLVAALAQAPAPPTAPAPATSPARILALREATRVALEHQPQLLQARAGTKAAEARSDEAKSGLLPQVAGTAAYSRLTNNFAPHPGSSPALGPVGSSTFTTYNYFQFGATLSQLIYDFGQTSGRWRSAQATEQSSRETELATRNQIVLGVQSAYFTARAGKDLVGVARDNLTNQDLHLRQTEAFVRAGTHPDIDLAQARTNYANAQVQFISAENAYETEKAQLNQAMGIDGPTDYDVADDTLPEISGEDLPLEPLLAEALKNRPDVTSLEAQARAQDLTLGSVKGAFWPTLGVSTSLTDAGIALDATAWNFTATATLTWNIYQGGLTTAQTREAQANLDGAEAQLTTLRQQVTVDVEQARLSVRASKESLGAAGEALVNAHEQLRLAEKRYETGVGNAVELGDAQVAYTTAAAQKVQADYNLATSRAQLLRALGREDPHA
jgi:outer membrane protein